jgi:molybdopterin converting factor small subunit
MQAKTEWVTVAINADQVRLFASLHEKTKISAAQLIEKILSAHTQELSDYEAWLEKKKDKTEFTRNLSLNLLHSYGPVCSLLEMMNSIDEMNGEKTK